MLADYDWSFFVSCVVGFLCVVLSALFCKDWKATKNRTKGQNVFSVLSSAASSAKNQRKARKRELFSAAIPCFHQMSFFTVTFVAFYRARLICHARLKFCRFLNVWLWKLTENRESLTKSNCFWRVYILSLYFQKQKIHQKPVYIISRPQSILWKCNVNLYLALYCALFFWRELFAIWKWDFHDSKILRLTEFKYCSYGLL